MAALAPLPGGVADGAEVRARGFAFIEGRDRLEHGPGPSWIDGVADLADRRPRALGQLPGDFAFLRWRPDGSALAVRACAGVAPIYLRRWRGGAAVGTLLNYFTRLLPERFELDPLINATWGPVTMFIDGRTFLRGVSILPRASFTDLHGSRPPRTAIYWDPRPGPGARLETDPERPARLRELLLEGLERDLDPGGRNLLTLSGGVDSSSLAALAAGVLGRGLSCLTLIPPPGPERSHELSYIDPLVEQFGIEPPYRAELSADTRLRWFGSFPGRPFQVIHPALCELPRIRAQQEVGVLVGGEFADEVCGSRLRMADWSLHSSLARIVARPNRLPYGRRDYLRWAKRRALAMLARPQVPFPEACGDWVHPRVRAEYEQWRRDRVAQSARDRRPLRELADRVDADGWVAMNWEGTTPLGIRRSIPFFTREVLELAFRCHPAELLDGGPKQLLRAALERDVPARNLLRPDKGSWSLSPSIAGVPRSMRRLPDVVHPLVRPDWLPLPPQHGWEEAAAGLLRAAWVGDYLEQVGKGDDPPYGSL